MPWPSNARAIVSRGAGLRDRLDGDVDHGSYRSGQTPDTPLSGRVEANELRGVGSVGEPDVSRRVAAIADLEGGVVALDMPANHTLLPFRKAAWVSRIRKHLFGRTIDLGADGNWWHRSSSFDHFGVSNQVERPPTITVDTVA